MSSLQEKLLGQLRPSGTSAEVVYSVPTDTTVIIKTIAISNVSSASMKYSIFVSEGTTYDESTAIAWNCILAKENSIMIDTFISLTGNVAFQVDTASSATITLFGAEV